MIVQSKPYMNQSICERDHLHIELQSGARTLARWTTRTNDIPMLFSSITDFTTEMNIDSAASMTMEHIILKLYTLKKKHVTSKFITA
jgi:hypothetical protein